MHHSKASRCRGNISELPLALFVFFLIMFFPLLNLLNLATGLGCVVLLAHQTATRAASQKDYSDALAIVKQEAQSYDNSGFAHFAKMIPAGGYQGCGVDLYVSITDMSGVSTEFGPNVPPTPAQATAAANQIFQYKTRAIYDVGPFINLQSVPFIGTVPGIGVPARLQFTVDRSMEHPEGLSPAVASGSYSSSLGGGPILLTYSKPSQGQTQDGSVGPTEWNTPNIYDMIEAAGQTVVWEDVLQVDSRNGNWTPTSVNLNAGDRLWIDYRSDGSWSLDAVNAPGLPHTNANGNASFTYPWCSTPNPFPWGAMLGRMGSGAPFFLGNQQWNMVPPSSGNLQLIMNDGCDPHLDPGWYNDNGGVQTVRLIVAR